MLDAGMTPLTVAMALRVSATVITHSLGIAVLLSERPRMRVILAGGEWDCRQRLLAGSLISETIRRYRADRAARPD